MSLTNLAFVIPGEPQGKGRGRIVRFRDRMGIATPEKTAAYEGLIALAAQRAMAGHQPLKGPVALEVEAVCSIPKSMSKKDRAAALAGQLRPMKKPDADNILKAVCDGMNGVAWVDDVQAVDVRMVKRYGTTPGVWVRVAAMEAA